LNDIESFLIPHALKARNERDFLMWAAAADMMLRIATEQREGTQDILLKYGPNLQSLGG
jgi:hypothetical protein